MADGVFDAVRTVLAIREYRDRKVGDDLIDRIVEARTQMNQEAERLLTSSSV